jgi:8-oxo-dGTP pyrophosphatase MutT (NUDIX family)
VREDRLVRSDGTPGLYSVVEKPTFAMIIPWDGERVTMVEQYRYPVGARYWEFPQGTLPGQDEVPAEVVAIQELREETGLMAGRMTQLGRLFIAYGLADQAFEVFLAEELSTVEAALEPEEQDLVSDSFTVDEIERMIDDARIMDAGTVAALYLWERHQRSIR